jgi:hypothetical protein
LVRHRLDAEHNRRRQTYYAFKPSFGVVIMFTSQTARIGLLPHVATAAALLFTIALGLAQSSAKTDAAVNNTAGVSAR